MFREHEKKSISYRGVILDLMNDREGDDNNPSE